VLDINHRIFPIHKLILKKNHWFPLLSLFVCMIIQNFKLRRDPFYKLNDIIDDSGLKSAGAPTAE
ncbi:MAG TPA: hypothetical protein VF149_04985, partial [Bacillales bacterium]